MTMSAKLRRAPGRVVTGAFILTSGLGKLGADDDTAKQLHGMAAGAYPLLEKVPPKPFVRALAASEIAMGAVLLLPVVPAGLAGLALVGFSGSLLGMWWRTPGMHEEGSVKPTQQGIPIAKDAWMLGIGTSLILDALLDPARNKRIELTTGAKVATARQSTKARSAAKLARVRAEARAAKAARKAATRAALAKDVSRRAFDKVTP
jgi:hypothetical protein